MHRPTRHYTGLAREAMFDSNVTPEQQRAFADLIAETERLAAHCDWLRQFQRKYVTDEKKAPMRYAIAEERQLRAEAHRIAALQPLSERLAEVVFREIERSGRVLVKAQLADAFHAALLRSGLARVQRNAA